MKRRSFLATSSLSGLALTRELAIGAFHAPARADEGEQRLGDLLIQRRQSDQYEVRFTPARDRALRLLQITDTHFYPGPAAERTAAVIRGLVATEKPDLVIHTGDFVNNDSFGQVEWKGLEIMNDLSVPWTLCFGNHDYPVKQGPGSLSLDEISGRIGHGLQGHVDSPAGRHYCFRYDLLPGDGVKPAASLFFFQVGYAQGDRKISTPQLEWFDRQIAADEEREVDAPITVFVHIPLLEYRALFERGPVEGVKGENVCFDSDTGESFARFARTTRVAGVFCGHDHVNNYHGDWEGIDLAYGRVTGWGGYGGPDWQRGGRLVELDLAAPRPLPRHREVFG
jgi:3',5'-cyclic AMP phosphodiesterase CpdA